MIYVISGFIPLSAAQVVEFILKQILVKFFAVNTIHQLLFYISISYKM
jgi:hypothetical protein